MGGEGYCLSRAALSDSSLTQVRSKAKRARSDTPRRWPSKGFDVSRYRLGASMEKSRPELMTDPGRGPPSALGQATSRLLPVLLVAVEAEGYWRGGMGDLT